MVLYLNRRQMEMVVDSLKQSMDTEQDTVEYEVVINRAERVMDLQCKDDKSTFTRGGKAHDRR